VLKKINRISKRSEFLEVKNKGELWGSLLFGVVKLNKGDDQIKFGFVVSKKISKRAVDRNKIKRKLSEVLKNKIDDFGLGTRVVFLAKKKLLEATIEEISKEINRCLKK
jgi:ribonuclease P protein component